MHGLSPGLSLPVNAEIKPMGGVVDCGLGVDSKTSPRRAAIEKAQAELQYVDNDTILYADYSF